MLIANADNDIPAASSGVVVDAGLRPRGASLDPGLELGN